MSHLVKKLTITAIAVFMLFSMSAFAQNDSNLSLIAKADKASKPAKAAAAPAQHAAATSSQNWMTHRFEISFQGGGVVGGNLGQPDIGSCTSTTTSGADGCDVNQTLNHDDTGTVGVYPGQMGNLRSFQRFGGIKPGNGGVWGLRLGFNVTPKWQLEFIYNHASTGTAFTNQSTLNESLDAFRFRGFPGSGQFRSAAALDEFDGHPHGDQNMYLFNLNRNFNAGGRVVPYIGAGVGAVSWYGNPKFDVISQTGFPSIAEFSKIVPGQTGFAFDLAAGAKIYLTPSFGVRGDVMNVMSFPEFKLRSRSIDVDGNVLGTPGAVVPISGDIRQSGKFNQTLFTGGVFWAFGGGWDNSHANAGSFSSDNFWDHWELSFNFGGVHGMRNASSSPTCAPALTGGCEISANGLGHDDGNGGVYPNKSRGTIPVFLGTGTLNPGDGWMTGLRLSYAFNPNWEVAATWNVTGTGNSLSNHDTLNAISQSFYAGQDTNGASPRGLSFLGGADGEPRGNQSMYLFNLNRTFHITRRFVPYVGAGLGWESWNNNPRVLLRADLTGSGVPNVADFSRATKNQSGFAWDLAAGAKYYLTRHWGVRFDVTDVFSYNEFTTDFQTIDTSGLYGTPGALVPVSGRLKYDGHFSQLLSSAGVFWSFGQGGTWNSSDARKAGTGAHAGRFELSFQTGGVIGGNLGEPDFGKCTSAVTVGGLDGCNVNQPLDSDGSGIYHAALGGLRNVQRFGGVEPGNGGLFGVRLGYNVTPEWQLEFVYNHTQAKTEFTNASLVQEDVISYISPRFTTDNRSAVFVQGFDGSAHGNQNMFLFNLNRNFNVSGRVVPYVGVGLGGVSWYGNPKLNIYLTNENNNSLSEYTKFAGSGTGFALNLQTGAKIYITNNFGIRGDFSNVMSFPEFTHRFSTIDVSDQLGFGAGSLVPISGKTTQSGKFNQAMFTAGVFWSLGGRMDTSSYKSPQGDRESMNDHWEIGFNFGGTHSGTWGPSGTSCAEGVAAGCDFADIMTHNTPNVAIYPGRLVETLPSFQAQGGVKPGDGWTTGINLAYNFTPDWQLELMWNTMGTGTHFVNKSLLDVAQNAFYSQCDCYTPPDEHRDFIYLDGADGNARGNQQQILVNLNRSFWSNHRIVPYIGAGLGAEVWNNNPRVLLLTNTTNISNGRGERIALFAKDVPSTTGFAVDIKGGLKFYVSRHWGLKAEMLNVTSFQDFKPRFTSIDLSGQFGTPGAVFPVSGRLTQSTRFNQTSGTGGVFFTF